MTREVPSCRVDVLTTDFGIMRPEQTGLPCAVQAARVVVTTGTESRSHVIIRIAEAPWSTAISTDRVAASFPVDFVSCIRADSPGRAEVSCLEGSEIEIRGAAVAVATLARAWGWDESPVIAVSISGTALTLSVDPQFANGIWTVTAR
jgi:hypothetical protein